MRSVQSTAAENQRSILLGSKDVRSTPNYFSSDRFGYKAVPRIPHAWLVQILRSLSFQR